MKPLIGYQLPLLPGVSPYLVSNPAACGICNQPRAVRGLTGSCPVCPWREAGLFPEHQDAGIYALDQGPSLVTVTERSPDYSQRSLSPEQAFAIGDEVKVLAVQAHHQD